MKILLVTEKYCPANDQRDGGARLIDTLQKCLSGQVTMMQFGSSIGTNAKWNFAYPFDNPDRFTRRILNADFIAQQVQAVAKEFTHIIFVHISMQFGFMENPLSADIETWTFPMFLTPSYTNAQELVPRKYTDLERLALHETKNVCTPSYFEKQQLIEYYAVPEHKIHVVPRGIDMAQSNPLARSLDKSKPIVFCSVGSIKPQKNTLELVKLFADLKSSFPNSVLRLIGPVQNQQYYEQVQDEINSLGIGSSVEFMGHVSPTLLSSVLNDCHIHLSTSACETFGRSIFETLACGIPNVARKQNNAAAEFLHNLPYIKFVDNNHQALQAIEDIICHFQHLSKMALEVGELYNDEMLAKLLAAKISQNPAVIISDYDGTLFHKYNPARTQECLAEFKQFPLKILCSARSTESLLKEMQIYNLQVDWIISYSGAAVSNGDGKPLWVNALTLEAIQNLENIFPNHNKIMAAGQVVQISVPSQSLHAVTGMRVEIYQGLAFFASWHSSKLRAICKLLHHIDWHGTVTALGDGPYDEEFLTYFDGCLINDKGAFKISKYIKE